jgi:hypothetical protein
MRRVNPAWAIAAACALAVSVSAQDTSVKSKSKTKIKADDAKTVALTGCLTEGANGTFTLTHATPQIDIETTLDLPPAGTTGASIPTYELMPRQGVSLSPHVGHMVEITALEVPPATASDRDAKVKVKSKSKVKVEDAPDAHVESRTKADVPRGATSQLIVASVKHLAATCQ